eukprot:TRINITY_DN822_c0_g2_i1.p1 TRINITY_DN822_c0_g2~~TRINITY_DN822_c0_g2_i1.p1  ORF type:complete len:552 (-),score=83.73 TRINITY_DN822_c0_g2_i1:209-1864(-)
MQARLQAIPLFNRFQLGDIVVEFSQAERMIYRWLKKISPVLSKKLDMKNRSMNKMNQIVARWAITDDGSRFFSQSAIDALNQYANFTPYKTQWDKSLPTGMVPWAATAIFALFDPHKRKDANGREMQTNAIGKTRAPNIGHSFRLSGNVFGVTMRKPVNPNRGNAFYNVFGSFNDTHHWLYSPSRTVGDMYTMTRGIDLSGSLSAFVVHRVAFTFKQMFDEPITKLNEVLRKKSALRDKLTSLIQTVSDPTKRKFSENNVIIRPVGKLPTDKQITSVPPDVLKLYSLVGLDPGAKSHKISAINFAPEQLKIQDDSVPWFVFVTLTLAGKPKNNKRKHEIPPLPSGRDNVDAWDEQLRELYYTQVILGQNYYLEEKQGRHALRKLDDRNAGIIHRLAYTLPELQPEEVQTKKEIEGHRLPILCFGAAKFSGTERKRLAEVCAQSMPVIMVDEHLTSQVCAQCCTIAEKVDRADVVGTRLFACVHCNANGGMYHKDQSASILIAQKVFFALNGIDFNSCSRMFNRLHRDTTNKIWDEEHGHQHTMVENPANMQ